MIARLGLICLIVAPFLPAQFTMQQEHILRLARIKSAIKRHLDGMPNYTCLQTVERHQRLPNASKESLIDILRLEVAYVADRELYAWPGSKRFEETELRDLVTTGAFSTGSFALHARAIFLGDGTTFRFAGEVDLEGQPALRFDYDTVQFRSGYSIRNPRRQLSATVAYHGTIWARRDDLELLRIFIEADDIPPEIEIQLATDRLDYQLMHIGSTDALLPSHSEVQITDNRGRVSINRTRLSRCKQYSGESTLSFEDATEGTSPSAKLTRELIFEPHTELELSLDQELNHEDFAVGDAIQATLRTDIRSGKTIIAAKGSIAKGRILRLSRDDGEVTTFNITLQFDELLGEGWRAPLSLRFLRTDGKTGTPLVARGRLARSFQIPDTAPNGFLVFSKKLKLSRGFTTIWQTQ